MRSNRVTGGGQGRRVVDGGSILVRTIGPWFVQNGPGQQDRVRFKVGDEAFVTPKLRDHLLEGEAVEVVEGGKTSLPKPVAEPDSGPKKPQGLPTTKRQKKAAEDKAKKPNEDKAKKPDEGEDELLDDE